MADPICREISVSLSRSALDDLMCVKFLLTGAEIPDFLLSELASYPPGVADFLFSETTSKDLDHRAAHRDRFACTVRPHRWSLDQPTRGSARRVV
jgi:hypothetical protein